MASSDLGKVNERLLLAAIREQEDAERFRLLAEDLEAALARERILAEASVVLTSSLDRGETLFKVPALVVPRIVDWCAIETVEDNGKLVHVAAAHLAAAGAAARPLTAREVDEQLSGGVIGGRVIRRREPEFRGEGMAPRSSQEPVKRLVTANDMRSYLCVPVVARQEVRALIWLATWTPNRRLGPTDLRFGEELARRAAATLEMSRLYEEARLALRMRDDVLATVAHDILSPLMAIRLSTRSLLSPESQTILDEVGRRCVERIRRSTEEIDYLVHQLSETASIHANQMVLRVALADVSTLVEAACDTADILASARSQRLVRHFPSWPVQVPCDAERIGRVLSNLLGNAIKFTDEGGTIGVSVQGVGTHVQIIVEDDGVGVPEADRSQIFKPYGRGTDTLQPGKGLGLFIARGIAEAHGGRLELDTVPRKGSRFVLTLPGQVQG